MMHLSGKITYCMEREKNVSVCFLPRLFMSVLFFLVFVLAVTFFWPEGKEVLQLMMIPGIPEETLGALDTFAAELDCGISITGAASDFLHKLIR